MQDLPAPPQILLDSLFTTSQDLSGLSLYTGDNSSSSSTAQFPTPKSPDDARPYVTLTFAQSVDAKIAGKNGRQLALSGKESLIMTHWSVSTNSLDSDTDSENGVVSVSARLG